MKINNQINFIEITKSSSSLYSLMADGQYRSTSLGRDKWKSVVGDDASLQLTCNIRKGSMQSVPWQDDLKQESVSLVTRVRIADNQTHQSDPGGISRSKARENTARKSRLVLVFFYLVKEVARDFQPIKNCSAADKQCNREIIP